MKYLELELFDSIETTLSVLILPKTKKIEAFKLCRSLSRERANIKVSRKISLMILRLYTEYRITLKLLYCKYKKEFFNALLQQKKGILEDYNYVLYNGIYVSDKAGKYFVNLTYGNSLPPDYVDIRHIEPLHKGYDELCCKVLKLYEVFIKNLQNKLC